MNKKRAENFVFGTTARTMGLEEICYCETTSALIKYYLSLQDDAQEHTE